MKEGFDLGTFRSKRMRVLYRSRQDDRLHVMLVLVHIDITPPQSRGVATTVSAVSLIQGPQAARAPSGTTTVPLRGLSFQNNSPNGV
ncbi:hypothetical protein TNCV_3307291 [Trichonephila clavipes]|nr:hypothetical protein TNCV_3307291 [Trichonephila clavipes]